MHKKHCDWTGQAKRLIRRVAFVLGLAAAWSGFATEPSTGPGLVTIASRHSVVETIDRFEASVKAAPGGFRVFSRVDFQELAASQGGTVHPSQLIVFGRGGVLQTLLSQAPVAAIDLPLKALAWEDQNGKVWLTYNSGEYLAQRHGLQGRDDVLKRLTSLIDKFARGAAE